MNANPKQSDVKRELLVDVYGRNAPAAAKFGVDAHVGAAKFGQGAQPAPQVEEATNARRNVPVRLNVERNR